MGELLQRLSAANQVVGQAEAEVERLEGQSVEAAQTAAAAQADAAAARAEAAGLREEVAELQVGAVLSVVLGGSAGRIALHGMRTTAA